MSITEEASLGLRERKNRRTRRAIARAAAELTLEGGYAHATIPRIAERADVAPRTVSTWFPVKDEILFDGIDDTIARGIGFLETGTGDVIARLEAWIAEEAGHEQEHLDSEFAVLRDAAIGSDPELRARARQHFERMHTALAEAAARDLSMSPDDVGPQAFAGAAMSAFQSIARIVHEDRADADAQFAVGIAFLRAGVTALADPAG